MTRLKLAELTSGVGALVLGLGLGALWPHWFGSTAGAIAVGGLVMHAFGMWDKHRLETAAQPGDARWAKALYWACWVLLAAVVVVLVFRSV